MSQSVMAPTLTHRLNNLAQTVLLLGGMAAVAWLVVSLIARPETTVVIVAVTTGGLLLAPTLSREFLLRGYHARQLSERDWPEGLALLQALSARAGLPRCPELWYVPSQLPNAFAMGNPEESVVCVSDGVVHLLSQRELAGVLAHEIAHIAHRDLWLMALADTMSRVVSLASWFGRSCPGTWCKITDPRRGSRWIRRPRRAA